MNNDTLRKALKVARQYVKLQNRAEGIFDGFGGRKPRPSDADLKMIDEALAASPQPALHQLGCDLLKPPVIEHDGEKIAVFRACDCSQPALQEQQERDHIPDATEMIAKPADPLQFLVDQAQELDMGYGKPAEQEKAEPLRAARDAVQRALYAVADGSIERDKWVTASNHLHACAQILRYAEAEQQAPVVNQQLTTQAPAITEQAPAGEVPGGLMQAIRGEVPLKEPVNISKALPAGRKAEVWLNNGTGPVACVGLVNIQLAGWRHTKETAEAFAEGYNRALADLRASILDVALSTPPAVPPGWKLLPEKLTQEMSDVLTEMLTNCHSVADSYSDLLSAAPAAPQGGQK